VSEREEQVARELADELRKLRVEDLLLGVLVQISSIGYRRLGLTEETREDRDLEQTKLAIDTMKALTPVLAQVVPGELIRDFESSVANLQLAYATAASDTSGDGPRTRPDETSESGEGAERPDTEQGSGARETPD
jgi:hypothetical protein